MDFYRSLNKDINIFFIFEGRINKSNKRKNKKKSIELIKSFEKINYLYPYSIN